MPIFEYKAINADNKVKKGIIDADTPRDARLKLKKDYLDDVQCTAAGLRMVDSVGHARGARTPHYHCLHRINDPSS